MKALGHSEPQDPCGSGTTARPGWPARLARLDAIIAAGPLEATATELMNALVLRDWRIVTDTLGFTGLLGKILRDGVQTGATIYTSPLLRLDLRQGWARAFSTVYRIDAHVPGLPLLSDEELRLAIARNIALIPVHPWNFEPAHWSTR